MWRGVIIFIFVAWGTLSVDPDLLAQSSTADSLALNLSRNISTEEKAHFLQQAMLLGSRLRKENQAAKALSILMVAQAQAGAWPQVRLAMLESIGEIYAELGDYHRSQEYYLQALKLGETVGDPTRIIKLTYALSANAAWLGQKAKALAFLQSALSLARKTQHSDWSYRCLNDLGGLYLQMGVEDSAKAYFRGAIQESQCLHHQARLSYSCYKLAECYLETQQADSAIYYLNTFLQAPSTQLNSSLKLSGEIAMGWAYRQKGENQRSLRYYLRALSMGGQIPISLEAKADLYRQIGAGYHDLGQTRQAYRFLQLYAALQDTLALVAHQQSAQSLRDRHELLQHELEARRQKLHFEQLAEDQRNLSGLDWIHWSAILVGLGVLCIFIWLLHSRYRVQVQANRALALQKEETELRAQQLASSNTSLERFAYVASHDMREPLRMIGGYASLLKRRYKGRLDADANEFIDYMTKGVEHMSALLNNLLGFARLSQQENSFEQVEIKGVIRTVLQLLEPEIKTQHAKIFLSHFPSIQGDESQLRQLFQNLIHNALKFSDGPSPWIWIDYIAKEDAHLFSVRDNGIGIDPKHQAQIFQIFQRLHSKAQYEGTGIGLATCQKIVENHQGRIWVRSELGQGSTFYFSIPRNLK